MEVEVAQDRARHPKNAAYFVKEEVRLHREAQGIWPSGMVARRRRSLAWRAPHARVLWTRSQRQNRRIKRALKTTFQSAGDGAM